MSLIQEKTGTYQKKRSVILSEDDVGGQARVTRCEERVLWGDWTINRDVIMETDSLRFRIQKQR